MGLEKNEFAADLNRRLLEESDPKLHLHLKRGETKGIGQKPKREKKAKISVPKSEAIRRLEDEYFQILLKKQAAIARKYSIDFLLETTSLLYEEAVQLHDLTGTYPPQVIERMRGEFKGWKFSDDSAKATTEAIIALFEVLGGFARPVGTVGTYDRKNNKFRPTQGMRGAADISGTIAGRTIEVEVKHGADRMSDNQKEFQAKVTKAGGVYLIARELADVDEYIREFAKLNLKPDVKG